MFTLQQIYKNLGMELCMADPSKTPNGDNDQTSNGLGLDEQASPETH